MTPTEPCRLPPAHPAITLGPQVAEKVREVLLRAYHHPFSVSGDFARGEAAYVAAAASSGLLTTAVNGQFTRRWRITTLGLDFIGPQRPQPRPRRAP